MTEEFVSHRGNRQRSSKRRSLLQLFIINAAAILTSASAALFPVSSASETIPFPERLVATTGVRTSGYLTIDQRIKFEDIFRKSLSSGDRQMVPTSDGTVYIKTGDINAEWLRDASQELLPDLYLARHYRLTGDKVSAQKLEHTIRAAIIRMMKCINRDPYANAFNENYTVHEKKFELDSLSYPVLVTWQYWKATGDNTILEAPIVQEAFSKVLHTMHTEQDHNKRSHYHFGDKDSPERAGTFPVKTVGLIWSAARPSDDMDEFNYLIPAQTQAVQALRALAEMLHYSHKNADAALAMHIHDTVHAAVEKYGIITVDGKKIYAYEVDGRGNSLKEDDANAPSLLSMPYWGYLSSNDPVYVQTRSFVLSTKSDPYYFTGSIPYPTESSADKNDQPSTESPTQSPTQSSAQSLTQPQTYEVEGVGSHHTPPGYIWPLAELMQIRTARSEAEAKRTLETLVLTAPPNCSFTESYDANNPAHVTRRDFAWPNALFAEIVLTQIDGWKPLPVPPAPKPGIVEPIASQLVELSPPLLARSVLSPNF